MRVPGELTSMSGTVEGRPIAGPYSANGANAATSESLAEMSYCSTRVRICASMRAALRKPIKSSPELHQVIARFEDDVAEAARDAKRQRMDDEDDITLRFEENQFSHSDLVALAASALGRHLQHLHVCPKYEDANTHILDFDGLCFPQLKLLELDSPVICALNFRGSALPALQKVGGYPAAFDRARRR